MGLEDNKNSFGVQTHEMILMTFPTRSVSQQSFLSLFFFLYSLVHFLFSSSSHKSYSLHLSFSVPGSVFFGLFLSSLSSLTPYVSLCRSLLSLSPLLSFSPLSFPQARPQASSTHIRHCTELAVRQGEKDWLAVV